MAVDGIPESMELVVEEPNDKDLSIADEAAKDHFDALRSSRTPNKLRDLFAYDISVQDAENNVWQPDGTKVDMELKIPDLHLDTYEKVYIAHNHNGTVEILEAKVDTSNGTVSFETDGFSTFYGFIVDFEYNGLKFSIDGGSEVQLSEIFKELKINRSVSQVKSVVFSDDSLIEITAKDGDYVLKSLKSFGTDEWLVVTFKDGTTIEIKVTDPVLFYYLDGTDWCMDTFSGTITRKDNKNGAEAPAGDVIINTEAITGAALGKTHGAGTADVIIYARPGMAIRVDRYSDFSNLNKETTYKDSNNNDYIIPKQLENNVSLDGLWRWVWGKDNGAGSDTTG